MSATAIPEQIATNHATRPIAHHFLGPVMGPLMTVVLLVGLLLVTTTDDIPPAGVAKADVRVGGAGVAATAGAGVGTGATGSRTGAGVAATAGAWVEPKRFCAASARSFLTRSLLSARMRLAIASPFCVDSIFRASSTRSLCFAIAACSA